MIGIALAGLVACALIALGIGALIAPRASSQQYGILLEDPRALAFVRAMGVRDLVIGALVGLLALAGRRDLLAFGMAAAAGIAVLDFVVVSKDRPPHAGSRTLARSHLLHGVGAIAVLIAAAVIALGL